MTSCTFDYLTQDIKNGTFVAGMYCFAFFLPVFAIFFFYTGIVKAIISHHDAMNAQAKKMGANAGDANKDRAVEMQMAKVAAMTIGFFLASWLPYASIAAMGMLYPHEAMMISPMWSEVPVMLAKTSGMWNPIIYAISHPKFRAEVDKTFPWLLCLCMPKTDENSGLKAKAKASVSSAVSKTDASEMTTSPSSDTINTVSESSPAANPV